MSALRIGIVGTGNMGKIRAKHLSAMEGVEVVGVCGTTEEKARGLGEKVGVGAFFTDFGAMLKRAKPDAVVIAIPPFAHAGQVEMAARKGVHLLLEKPVALTLKRARLMQRAIEKAGVVAHVGHHMRFGPAVRKLAGAIESGEAGRPLLVQGRYFANALHVPWWRDQSKSGGQIVEQAIHAYDLACLFLGKPTGVSALKANLVHGDVADYTVEDTSAATVAFESGAMASMCASNAAIPKQWICDLRVVCSRVTVDFAAPDKATFIWNDGQRSEHFFATKTDPRIEPVDTGTDLLGEETRAWVASLRAGRTTGPGATFGDGFRALELVLAADKSAAKGGRWTPIS